MAYKPFYIFVEGPDDTRFVKRVLVKTFSDYTHIQVQEYSQEKPEKIDRFIKSIKSLGGEYLFLCDMDRNPCVTQKVQKILEKYKRLENRKGVFVVIKEIESWYLAGISADDSKSLGLDNLECTDDITKEVFNEMMPNRFDSRVDFMQEILKSFSINVAANKNASFNYVASKLGLIKA